MTSIYDKEFVTGLVIGIKRHTWMRDGVTYVGNGTYTLEDAIKLLKIDYKDLANLIDEVL